MRGLTNICIPPPLNTYRSAGCIVSANSSNAALSTGHRSATQLDKIQYITSQLSLLHLTYSLCFPENSSQFYSTISSENAKIYLGAGSRPHCGETKITEGAFQFLQEHHIWLPSQTILYGLGPGAQVAGCWDEEWTD